MAAAQHQNGHECVVRPRVQLLLVLSVLLMQARSGRADPTACRVVGQLLPSGMAVTNNMCVTNESSGLTPLLLVQVHLGRVLHSPTSILLYPKP